MKLYNLVVRDIDGTIINTQEYGDSVADVRDFMTRCFPKMTIVSILEAV